MTTSPSIWLLGLAAARLASGAITIPKTLSGGKDILDGFVSYSIEFSSFPDYAGNSSKPNTFSDNLLNNIGNIIGTKPYIRVGGNTQDFALYDSSQSVGLKGITKDGDDYPTNITIGDAYFESYSTWDNTKFSHGFNLGLGGSTADGWQTLLDTVPLACKALGSGKLYTWEYGNEPNLYAGQIRDDDWGTGDYVDQWKNGTDQIKALLKQHCSGLAANFMAPSYSGADDAGNAFGDGLDSNGDLKYFSTHNYIAGAQDPGVTLQDTLMNHENVVSNVDAHMTEYTSVQSSDSSAPPMILGETNSLYNQGKPGLSNTFGAALWGVDFNLYSASVGIKRVHMHQGTNYRYASWQPIDTDDTVIGTKAPYYGNVAVAAMLGNLIEQPAQISNIDLGNNQEVAYAAYTNSGSKLARVMVINMNGYNTTANGAGVTSINNPPPRPSKTYSFAVEGVDTGAKVLLQRLLADGSDAISGITWDGYSYNYELNEGKPVRQKNVTIGETVKAKDGGVVTVQVPDSSAVVLSFGLPEKDGKPVPQNHGEQTPGSPGSGSAQSSGAQPNAARRGMNILWWEV